MLFSALKKLVEGASNVLLTILLILLWFSEYALNLKIGGTVALLVVAGLVGWYGARFRAWRRDRKRFG